MPTKYRLSTDPAWILNRARRIAAAVTYTKPAAQPQLPSAVSPHENVRMAGRDAERDDIGQRIELHPELTRGAGHPRDPAVERIQHHRDADERRRHGVFAAHRVDHAGVSAEHVAERHQARQQVHAATQPPLGDVRVPAMRSEHVHQRYLNLYLKSRI